MAPSKLVTSVKVRSHLRARILRMNSGPPRRLSIGCATHLFRFSTADRGRLDSVFGGHAPDTGVSRMSSHGRGSRNLYISAARDEYALGAVRRSHEFFAKRVVSLQAHDD